MMTPSYSRKHVLVLGLGDSGLSAVRWLCAQGARVRVADTRQHPPGLDTLRAKYPQVEFVAGAFADTLFVGADLVVASPGVPLADPVIRRARAGGLEIIGDVELFARALPGDARVIAITGSNGKTTTTTLVGEMVRAAGHPVCVAGNIGLPVLDALCEIDAGVRQAPAYWVLELSSFQLEGLTRLRSLAASVLNVSEDHLDRYPGMPAYADAKARIFSGSRVAVLNRDDDCVAAMAGDVADRRYFTLREPQSDHDYCLHDGWLMLGNQRLIEQSALRLAGTHNVANALAALALCEAAGLPRSACLAALQAFKGLPHRVEFVAEHAGVRYYDDSKGTNVGATLAALAGLGRPVVVILGGEGKGQDFRPLAPVLAQHGRAAVLIGRDAPLIRDALAVCPLPLREASDMRDAVRQAAGFAQPGDAVLLSPACASFDMFRNYAHRAEVFVAEVAAFTGGRAA
jgi:UDP-N-acetylmuramoylalanine--D-glutamate ligase